MTKSVPPGTQREHVSSAPIGQIAKPAYAGECINYGCKARGDVSKNYLARVTGERVQ